MAAPETAAALKYVRAVRSLSTPSTPGDRLAKQWTIRVRKFALPNSHEVADILPSTECGRRYDDDDRGARRADNSILFADPVDLISTPEDLGVN